MGQTKGGIMSSTEPGAGAPDAAGDVRRLPPRPSLQFERNQAKKLLAQLHRDDPEALARVRRFLKRAASQAGPEFQLSDAQFAIAREYGFLSWPRLVEYFEALARHEVSGPRERHRSPRSDESWARTIVAEHKDRRAWTVQFLTAYVPRFHGRSTEQVFGSEVTLEDAKLATARMHRYPSWEVMAADYKPADAWSHHDSPAVKASRALRAGDFAAVERLIQEHPSLLEQEHGERAGWSTIGSDAILWRVKEPSEESRRAWEWVSSRADLQPTLNWMVLGHMRMTLEEMQRLLDLGADPTWLPPNGYSVLEHVIWRCWNGAIVDLIASRVQEPRRAFWVAAGLGDVETVRQFFDDRGVPTGEARENRPDFTALGPFGIPSNPAPDDQEIVWEAFMVAAFNQRFEVMDVLLDRGFPIDYIGWGQTVLHVAVGNGWLPLVEYLVRRGADLDLKGWRPYATAREIAEEGALNPHGHKEKLRILELCGGRDIETLRRDRAAERTQRVMGTTPGVEQLFDFAKQDAARRGATAVDQESLFIGMLRQGRLEVSLLGNAGVDLSRLRESVKPRLDPDPVDVPASMTANPEVSSILMDARTLAEQKGEEAMNSAYVLYALVQRASPRVLELIQSAGGTQEKVLAAAEQVFPKDPPPPT
jgi:hypothetical protein